MPDATVPKMPGSLEVITALLAQLPADTPTKDFREICLALKDFQSRHPELLSEVHFGSSGLSRKVEEVLFRMGVWGQFYVSARGYRTTPGLVKHFEDDIAPRLNLDILAILREEGRIMAERIKIE